MTLATRQALPITMGDVTITPASLQGYNYVSGLPTALQAMLLCATTQWDGVTQAGTVIYAGPSAQRIFVSIGKGWITGARLVLAALDQGGNTVFCLVRVISYNAVTGEFWIENLYQNVFIANFATVWSITSQYPDTILGTPLAVTSGGTGGADIRTARSGLTKWRMESGYSVLFDDFAGSPEASVTQDTHVGAGVRPYVRPFCPISPDTTNHPGTLYLTVTAATGAGVVGEQVAYFPFNPNAASSVAFSGANTVFEAAVYIPTLSNVTDRFVVSVGLVQIGFGSVNGSTTFNYFKARYCDQDNSGAWTAVYRLGAGEVVTNSAITVAAATWYKIRIANVGANIVLSINGTTVLTLANSTIFNNLSRIGVSLMKLIGTSAVATYVDYLYYKQQLAR